MFNNCRTISNNNKIIGTNGHFHNIGPIFQLYTIIGTKDYSLPMKLFKITLFLKIGRKIGMKD